MKPYLLLMLIVPSFVECEQRRVVASGKVTCDGKPYKGAKVKIISKSNKVRNSEKQHNLRYEALYFLSETLMDNTYGSVYSDENGEFNIDGSMDEIFAPDAELKIYHDCDDGMMVSKIFATVYNSKFDLLY